MRFDSFIKVIFCVQVSFFACLVFNHSLAQENHSFQHWQEQTSTNPMDPQAWFNLGVLYEKGDGVAANLNKAQQSYSRSVELGYAPAMFNLGSIYAQKKDYTNAKFWWEKAANENVPEAQYNLATLYEKGWGVKQNPEKAALWYQRAAETAMQKYLDLYQQSREKLKDQSSFSGKNISIFDHLSIVPVALAASNSELIDAEIEKIDQNTDPIQLAQADSNAQQLTGWPWIYSQPAENFTIQLFATKEQAKTDKFIQQYALAGRATVIASIVKGTQYYKVILGSFTQWNDAAVEIGALPQDLRDQRPWVRKFSTLYPELPEGVETSVAVEVEEVETEEQQEQSSEQVTEAESVVVEESVEETQAGQTESVEEIAAADVNDETLNSEAGEDNLSSQVEQTEQQVASLDKQEPVIEPRMPEETASENDRAVDDVFTLYAKRQLASNGLSDQIKQQLQTGLESIKAQDHAKGYEQLAPLADSGLPEAQFRLSLLYAEGKGVGLDLNKAFEYAKLSAEQGHPYGQRLLAEFYENGVGTQINTGLATYWKQTAEDNIKKLEEL